MKGDAFSEGLSGVLGLLHSECQSDDRMVLTCQERYSVFTKPARPHLLVCGITTQMHSEIYLLTTSMATSTHSRCRLTALSAFTHVFFLLTRVVPAGHKVLWKISTSPLRTPGKMPNTNQWIIQEPTEGMRNAASPGTTTDWKCTVL